MANQINKLAKKLTGNINVDETEITNNLRNMIEEKYTYKSEQFKLIDWIDLDTQINAKGTEYKSRVSKKDLKRLIQITK